LVKQEVFFWLHVNGLIALVDADQLVFDELVVGHVLVLEALDVVEDVLDLLNILGFVPEQSLWRVEAIGLDVLYFVHCVLLDLTPDKLLFQEVKNDKVQTPEIIAP
jgi:hypothetical protein